MIFKRKQGVGQNEFHGFRTEAKRVPERISIKEKLAEKKAIIDQKSKGDKLMQEKDTEKKTQREM